MTRATILLAAVLLGGCDTLADLWVRRDFSADTNLSGFAPGNTDGRVWIQPYLVAEKNSPRPPARGRQPDPPAPQAVTQTAMAEGCRQPTGPGVQTDRDLRLRFGPPAVGVIAANAVLAVGEMVYAEINARLDSAADRLIDELSSTTAAAVSVPRLLPGTGGACYVVTRMDDEQKLLWEFGFRIQGLQDAPEAARIDAVSLVMARGGARTRNGGNVDMNITVTVQAPRQDFTVGPRGTSDFILRGVAPEGDAATQRIDHMVPRVGQAFMAPGSDRFAVIGVTVTEMGQGGDAVLREQAFRQRHQAAVRSLLRGIAADRLGIEPLPGRP